MKLKQLIRKLKVLIYVMIGIVGIIMVIWGCMVKSLSNNLNTGEHSDISIDEEIDNVGIFPAEVQYDIFIGIGGGFVSSAAVTLFLLAILPEESNESQELQEWGIRRIYQERSNIEIELKGKHPHEHLDFIAFGLSHFISKNSDQDIVATKVKKGLIIRILTLNPYSRYVFEQEKLENNRNIKNEILELERWVNNINNYHQSNDKTRNQIQIKFYDELPLNFYCRVDDKVYVGPYVPDKPSGKNITYQYDFYSSGGRWYSDLFERIWNSNSIIRTTEQYNKYHYVEQGESIRSILKYFCDKIQDEIQGEKVVVGVIAILKGELRRTFFSCNKKEENHKVHKKDEGTVGLMFKEFKDPNIRKVIVFNDYENNIAIAKKYQLRKNEMKKLQKSAVKMENNDETVAILAMPITINSELLGTLTFDFAELPCNYLKIVEKLKKNSNISEEILGSDLGKLFDEIEKCGEIVVKLLGQEMKMEYKVLYEEEWKNEK